MADYRDVNRASWDERVPAHVASAGYQVDRFAADPGFLSEAVRFDQPRLSDISGLRGVHLQCHIGTDTGSLARLGASMTGLDFSAPAVAAARELATGTGADATFVQGDVDVAPDLLERGRLGPGHTRGGGALRAARPPPLGPGGERAAGPGRAAVPARGAPHAVGAGRHPRGPPA